MITDQELARARSAGSMKYAFVLRPEDDPRIAESFEDMARSVGRYVFDGYFISDRKVLDPDASATYGHDGAEIHVFTIEGRAPQDGD